MHVLLRVFLVCVHGAIQKPGDIVLMINKMHFKMFSLQIFHMVNNRCYSWPRWKLTWVLNWLRSLRTTDDILRQKPRSSILTVFKGNISFLASRVSTITMPNKECSQLGVWLSGSVLVYNAPIPRQAQSLILQKANRSKKEERARKISYVKMAPRYSWRKKMMRGLLISHVCSQHHSKFTIPLVRFTNVNKETVVWWELRLQG